MFKHYRLLFVGFYIFLFLFVNKVEAATIVSACGTTISSSGSYIVNQSISSSGTCLTIATSDVDLDCNGSTITYNTGGGNNAYGIDVSYSAIYLNNVSIHNCIIQDNTTGGSGGYGIRLARTQNSWIYNNSIQTNGTSTCNGIVFEPSSIGNKVENNTIRTFGSSISNHGIVLSSFSGNNTIRGNWVNATGTTDVYSLYLYHLSNDNLIDNNTFYGSTTTTTGSSKIYAVYLYRSSQRNIFTNNYLSSFGAADNPVIRLEYSSDNTRIIGNTIINSGREGSNYGVGIMNSDNNFIYNNTIQTNGTNNNMGVYLGSSSLYNNISNNLILPRGTTHNNIGVYLEFGADLNTITNNNITTYGLTSGNIGIYIRGANNDIFNNWISAKGLTTNNKGIYVYGGKFNNLTGNTIFTNGTDTNHGLQFIGYSNKNYASQNSIYTFGTGNSNYGIQTDASNENIITKNVVFTNGLGYSNHGMLCITSSKNNTFSYNNVSVYGVSGNYGSYIDESIYNKFIGNRIITNGSVTASGTNTANYGLYLQRNSFYNEIENNTYITWGGLGNNGIYLSNNVGNTLIKGNIINSNGNGSSNYGILLSEARDNLLFSNLISTNGSSGNLGIYLTLDSRNNILKQNNISTFGSTDSRGVYLAASAPNYPHNATLEANNFLSIAGTQFYVATASIDNFTLIDQNISTYYLTGVGSLITVKNSSAGQIKFLQRLTGTTQTDFSNRIIIRNNYAYFNESVSGINKSAEITLYNLPITSTQLQINRNGAICPVAICTNLTSMQAGNVTFNVTQGGNYTIIANSSLPLVNLNLPVQSFNSTSKNINFNFTFQDDSAGNGNCSIYLDGILNQTNSSAVNNTLTNFLIQGISEGNHSWYIGCYDSFGNFNSSETRTFNISIVQPSVIYNSPSNNSYFNNADSFLLNYSVYDNDLNFMSVWLYGNGALLNTSENVVNGTTLTYNWTSLNIGSYNWSVITGNGIKNSSQETQYFNLINLSVNCEVGGDYSTGALVLIFGNISDGTIGLNNQQINASVYSLGALIQSKIVNSSSSGDYYSTFSGLAIGNYTLNVSTSYQGFSKICIDAFSIDAGYDAGYNAGFIAGNESGYISGFNQGNITGFNLGNISGFIFGNQTGFDTGFILGNQTGFLEGYSAGNTTGFILGNESGYITGYATGFSLGNTTGFILGNQSGFILGNVSGYLLGFNEGNQTGYLTGFTLGNLTGYLLGNISGFYFGNQTGYESGYDAGYDEGFVAGSSGPASFVLDKIASFYNISNESISYNITLRITNKGKNNASLVNITDSDSNESPYSIGVLNGSQVISRSYIKTFSRNSTDYFSSLSIAQAQGIDSFSNSSVFANSSSIDLTIPSSQAEEQLTLIKNVYFNSENSTQVNYTISIEVINSGGSDLIDIPINDQDLDLSTIQSLNRTQNYSFSDSIIIEKEATNLEYAFEKTTAYIGSTLYESNELNILIPGYGGPADTIVYAPSSVYNNTNFNSIIEIINQNEDIGQNFILDYWITNNDESANYSSGQKTLYVAASDSINTTVTLTSPSSAGTYKLKAVVSYMGGPDIAFDSFEVLINQSSPPVQEEEEENNAGGGGGGGGITGEVVKDEVVCNIPYIRYAKECCLDSNNNSICDRDEVITNQTQENKTAPLKEEEKEWEMFKSVKNIFSNIGNAVSSFVKFANKIKSYVFIVIGILIFSSVCVFGFIYLYKIIKKRKRDMRRLGSMKGTKVYAGNGNYIGKIMEIYLDENKGRVYGWLIKLDKKLAKKIGIKKILVKHEFVQSISNIMLVSERVHEHLENFTEGIN